MAGSPAVRAGDIVFDGKVPLFTHNSGLMAHAVAAVNGAFSIAPCDLYIERAWYSVAVAATHANAEINFGSYADPDAFLDLISLTNVAAGTYEIDLTASTTVTRIIPKGTLYNANLVAASAVGSVAFGAVLRPYAG